jgi:hypothetical protein
MKSKPHRKKREVRRASKSARTRKFQSQAAQVGERGLIEFSCGVGDDEALAIEESLDERERRG